RRLLPAIRSANRAERLAAERVAMNMPIQGTAADLLKLAMLSLATPVTPGARMILTVHDELVFEVPEAEVPEAVEAIRSRMESVRPPAGPLVVEVGHGKDWNDAHGSPDTTIRRRGWVRGARRCIGVSDSGRSRVTDGPRRQHRFAESASSRVEAVDSAR